MSWITSIFGKKKKGIKAEVPELFNALYEFNHENIIENSQNKENKLVGCEISDTLFLEGPKSVDSIGFLFIGNEGLETLSVMHSITSNIAASLLLANDEILSNNSLRVPTIELPSISKPKDTFFEGTKWYENNKERIEEGVQKLIKDVSLVFIFTENTSFNFGLLKKIMAFIKIQNIQPVIILKLPPKNTELSNEISTLMFILSISQAKEEENFSYLLLDEEILRKSNKTISSDVLTKKFQHRIATVIVDLISASQMPSKFYQTDQSNFIRIFDNCLGPCKLLSYDIYDDKPSLSGLLKDLKQAESFNTKQQASRGFLIVQPGLKGLQTKEYRVMRNRFSKIDVVFSILEERGSGSLIRGVQTFNETPKILLERYAAFSDIMIEIVSDEDQVIGYVDLSEIEKLWDIERYYIKPRPKPEKK
ncbi:MAG: hypothetical protein KAS95_02855 [Candidatus Heimdallarchaeota archaeon]|nr:hypothetical protein [Candidatus Heimdallarchaeota archaeon]